MKKREKKEGRTGKKYLALAAKEPNHDEGFN